MNSQVGLLQSRRFWLFVVDGVSTLIIYFVSKYFGANLDDVRMILIFLNGLAAFVIAAYTIDDNLQASRQLQLEMHQAQLANQLQVAQLQARK